MDYICDYCSGLLVPGLSAKIKVQHQKHHAPINRKLARQRRQWRKRHPFETAPRAPETLRNALVCNGLSL
jgi:RNase P subunit RPR2